jgi:hypothetical protein
MQDQQADLEWREPNRVYRRVKSPEGKI